MVSAAMRGPVMLVPRRSGCKGRDGDAGHVGEAGPSARILDRKPWQHRGISTLDVPSHIARMTVRMIDSVAAVYLLTRMRAGDIVFDQHQAHHV